MGRLPPLLFLFLLGACQFAPPHQIPWDERSFPEQRAQLVADAQSLRHAREFRVGARSYPFDCSGFVAIVLYRNGIDVYKGATELQIRGNGVRLLYEHMARYSTLFTQNDPKPGDLVFFSRTYDSNRDGRSANDALTHIGLVEEVADDGTVTFIHNLHGVRRNVMNLRRPHDHKDENGKVVNDYLRRRRRGDTRNTPHLGGELFTSFGSVVKDRQDSSESK
ncbi:MAG: CHAP domain-containing protein [Pseudomonadota bacterium]